MQVVTLVITRWLLGFCFSKHDLDLLDDPFPESLYCRPCRDKQQRSKPLDLNLHINNNSSVDTLGSSTQCSTQEDVAVTLEPKPGGLAADADHHQHVCLQYDDDFNITHEVDKCDLWKNMVRSHDTPSRKPLTSSTSTSGSSSTGGHTHPDTIEMAVPLRQYETGGWHHTMDPQSRTLCTLEECDTDLESQAQLPDYESASSQVASPLMPSSQSKQWGGSNGSAPTHKPSYTSLQPQKLAYRTTSV